METSLANRRFRRILIIKPSSIGDVIHALPILQALRRHWPDAHLAWLVTPGCADVLRGNRLLDEVILFDRADYGFIGRRWTSTRRFVNFLADLRRKRFELVIDAQGLFRSAFLAWATAASVRIGFGPGREFAWIFYTHRHREDMRLHAVDRMMELLSSHGVPNAGRHVHLDLEAKAEDRAAQLLSGLAIDSATPFAALVPGARWETKCWAWEKYARLADELADLFGLRSILLGSPAERDVCGRVHAAARTRPADLAGQTDLQTAGAILKRAAVVVCNDSGGSMHLAAALGRPLVAIFGPTNPHRTGPYGALHSVVSANVPCAPCYLRHISQCPFQMRCMELVTVEMVVQRVRQAIGPTGVSPCSASARV